jgi:hypothetical protein
MCKNDKSFIQPHGIVYAACRDGQTQELAIQLLWRHEK